MSAILEYLGGFIPGGDEATMYPMMWKWLVEEHGVKTVLDIGCGDGAALKQFRDLGCEVLGVDGVPQDDADIIEHDYTHGVDNVRGEFGLVWCCEFVEHVEERYVANFIESFKQGRLVLLTHADPGQQGHHHVNCRTSDYWVGAMAAIGYVLDRPLTEATRALSRTNTSPFNHYARSGLAFVRADQ